MLDHFRLTDLGHSTKYPNGEKYQQSINELNFLRRGNKQTKDKTLTIPVPDQKTSKYQNKQHTRLKILTTLLYAFAIWGAKRGICTLWCKPVFSQDKMQ